MIRLRSSSTCAFQLSYLLLLQLDSSFFVEARWNATGVVRTLWATPIMEYNGLFSEEQLSAFATDVKTSWSSFLKERSSSKNSVVTKSQAYGTSTANDKDKINEEFFNYQSRNPINYHTLETVWQGFVFACNKVSKASPFDDTNGSLPTFLNLVVFERLSRFLFLSIISFLPTTIYFTFRFAMLIIFLTKFVDELDLPPIEYQRETLAGGSLEWTTDKFPKRGNQVCRYVIFSCHALRVQYVRPVVRLLRRL